MKLMCDFKQNVALCYAKYSNLSVQAMTS